MQNHNLAHRKFRVEQLEERQMMAADIFVNEGLDAGTIEIHGTDGDDVVEVTFEGYELKIDLTVPEEDGDGTDQLSATFTLPIFAREKIRFFGFDGNDDMIVRTVGPTVNIQNTHIYFYGDEGNDTFDNLTNAISWAHGGAGDDILLGGNGYYDTLWGDEGDDTLNGRGRNNIYKFDGANLGSDTIDVEIGQGWDTIDLQGLHRHNASPNRNYTFLNLSASYTQNVFYAQNGEHFQLTLTNPEAIENAIGTGGKDYLFGNNQNNRIDAGFGDDWVDARAGHDTVYGGYGNDVLFGGQGIDTIYAGSGNDVAMGDEVAWHLYSAMINSLDSAGNTDIATVVSNLQSRFGVYNTKMLDDALHSEVAIYENPGQYGNRDRIFGGNGIDILYGGSGNDELQGGYGSDIVIGGGGNDHVYGDTDFPAKTGGNDYLFGMAGDDNLYGSGGDDWLLGGDGADELWGGFGNDWLYGREDGSQDTLHGEDGYDRFIRYYYYYYGWKDASEELETDFDSRRDYHYGIYNY